jgi:hypothetical protein
MGIFPDWRETGGNPVILDRINIVLEDNALLVALEDESLTITVDRLPEQGHGSQDQHHAL